MTFLVLGITIILLLIWLWFNYKSLLVLKLAVSSHWLALDEKLRSRHQETDNLIDYLSQHTSESDLLSKLRSQLSHANEAAKSLAGNLSAKRQTSENELADIIGQVLSHLQTKQAIASDSGFKFIRDQLLDAEDALVIAQNYYEDASIKFNMRQTIQPTKFLASKAGMQPAIEFALTDFFAKYPLKLEATLPKAGKSMLFANSNQSASTNNQTKQQIED